MSIGWKMTWLYTALLTLLLASFSATVYLSLQTFLLEQAVGVAQGRARLVDAHAGGGVGHGDSISVPALADEFASPGVYLQVWDATGRLIDRSTNLGVRQLPLAADDRGRVLRGEGVTREIALPLSDPDAAESEHLLVWHEPLREAGTQVGLVQVAVPLAPADALLGKTALLLAVGSVVIVALALPAGFFLARMLLAPVDRITQTARTITGGDLSRRIEYQGPTDEVGRLATTFDEMIGALDNALQAQRRFLSDAGHELRTPVTTILGHTNFLRRRSRADANERQEAIESILSAAQDMSLLVDNLLELAKSDEHHTLNRAPLALDELLRDVHHQATQVDKGLNVRLDVTESVTVLGDRDQIRRLFRNLVDNALKFTPSGGQVTVSLERADNHVRISVEDNGIGIPHDELPHIFKRFYQTDRSRSNKHGGYGLGLPIAHRIARAHGGSIEVKSAVGQGSTFTVWLPSTSGKGVMIES